MVTDNFISRLKSKGFKIEYNTDAPYKIIGFVKKSSTHHEIKIKVVKNKKIIAEYSNKFRIAFPGEQSDNAFLSLFFTVQQSTPTRLLFPDFWQGIFKKRQSQVKYPVSKFLSKVFSISPQIETLDPVNLKITSSIVQAKDIHILKEKSKNNIKNFCSYENTRVDIVPRVIIDEESPESRKWAGYWVRIRQKDKPEILTYLQAPQDNIYRNATIHKTLCTSDHIYVLVSFVGVGKSEKEWGSSFKTYEEINMIQKELRKAWILKYSYDGSLEEADVFRLPYDFPQHVDNLTQNGIGAWHFSGYNGEVKLIDGKWWSIISKKYDVLLEKDE